MITSWNPSNNGKLTAKITEFDLANEIEVEVLH